MKKKEIKPKNKGGRPTDYNEEILTKSREYLNGCGEQSIVKDRPSIVDGKVSEETVVKHRYILPTIEGLGLALKISRETIYQWEKEEDKKEFSDILRELRQMQADMLIGYGLSGDYNSTIAKVLLTKHGYREGKDITTNDKDFMVREEEKQVIDDALDAM